MKTKTLLLTAILGLFTFNGCDGFTEKEVGLPEGDTRELISYSLVNEGSYPIEGIPYICDSMSKKARTDDAGLFYFVEGDTCQLDFEGYTGIYNTEFDDEIFINNEEGVGVKDVVIECKSYGKGETYEDGGFAYSENDKCKFYF